MDVLSNEVAQRIATVDLFSVGAKYHKSCFIKFVNISASSIQDHQLSVAGIQQVATLPAWIIDGGTIPVNNHHDCLRVLGPNNGMEIVNTISGGSCFFDAVRQCALQFGFVRSVEELRVAAALELKIHSQQYRPLYIVEDHGQFVQAPTYDLFVDRTENGVEWATAMTVAAMAVAIGIPIKVISTATNASGLITAYQIDNAEGVNYSNEMIVVGYNSATALYVGFRSVNFNRFLQVEQDLSAEFRKISCFNPPTMISNDDDVDMSCGNIVFDDDDDDDVNMSNFGTNFPNEETEFVFDTHPQPPPYSSMDFSTSPLLSEEDDNIFPGPVSTPIFDNYLPCALATNCQNCLRTETVLYPLNISHVGFITKRQFRIVKADQSDYLFCLDCQIFLNIDQNLANNNLWIHGWPSVIACLLTKPMYGHIRAELWNLLPAPFKLSWTELASDIPLNCFSPTFQDFGADLSLYNKLIQSGLEGDFIKSMDDFAWSSVKCPAGCNSYVNECRTFAFSHFLAWKFNLSIYGGDDKFLTGARSDWPRSTIDLGVFFQILASLLLTMDCLSCTAKVMATDCLSQ